MNERRKGNMGPKRPYNIIQTTQHTLPEKPESIPDRSALVSTQITSPDIPLPTSEQMEVQAENLNREESPLQELIISEYNDDDSWYDKLLIEESEMPPDSASEPPVVQIAVSSDESTPAENTQAAETPKFIEKKRRLCDSQTGSVDNIKVRIFEPTFDEWKQSSSMDYDGAFKICLMKYSQSPHLTRLERLAKHLSVGDELNLKDTPLSKRCRDSGPSFKDVAYEIRRLIKNTDRSLEIGKKLQEQLEEASTLIGYAVVNTEKELRGEIKDVVDGLTLALDVGNGMQSSKLFISALRIYQEFHEWGGIICEVTSKSLITKNFIDLLSNPLVSSLYISHILTAFAWLLSIPSFAMDFPKTFVQEKLIPMFAKKTHRQLIQTHANVIVRKCVFYDTCKSLSEVSENSSSVSEVISWVESITTAIIQSRVNYPFLEPILTEPLSQLADRKISSSSCSFAILEHFNVIKSLPTLIASLPDIKPAVAKLLIAMLRRGDGVLYLAHVVERTSETSEKNLIKQLVDVCNVEFSANLIRNCRSVYEIPIMWEQELGDVGEEELNELKKEIEIETVTDFRTEEEDAEISEVLAMATYQIHSLASTDRIMWADFIKSDEIESQFELLLSLGIFHIGKSTIASSVIFTNALQLLTTYASVSTPTAKTRPAIRVLGFTFASALSIARLLDPANTALVNTLCPIDYRNLVPNQTPQTLFADLLSYLQPVKSFKSGGLESVLSILVTPRTLRELNKPASATRTIQCLRIIARSMKTDGGMMIAAKYVNDSDFVEFEGPKSEVTLVEMLLRIIKLSSWTIEKNAVFERDQFKLESVKNIRILLIVVEEALKVMNLIFSWYDCEIVAVKETKRQCPLTGTVDDDGWLRLREPKGDRPTTPLFEFVPVLLKLLETLCCVDNLRVAQLIQAGEQILSKFFEVVVVEETGSVIPRYFNPLEKTLKCLCQTDGQQEEMGLLISSIYLAQSIPIISLSDSKNKQEELFQSYWSDSLKKVENDLIQFITVISTTELPDFHAAATAIATRTIRLLLNTDTPDNHRFVTAVIRIFANRFVQRLKSIVSIDEAAVETKLIEISRSFAVLAQIFTIPNIPHSEKSPNLMYCVEVVGKCLKMHFRFDPELEERAEFYRNIFNDLEKCGLIVSGKLGLTEGELNSVKNEVNVEIPSIRQLFPETELEDAIHVDPTEILQSFEFGRTLKLISSSDISYSNLKNSAIVSCLNLSLKLGIPTHEIHHSESSGQNNQDSQQRNRPSYRQYQRNEFRTSHVNRKLNTSRPPSMHVDDFMKSNSNSNINLPMNQSMVMPNQMMPMGQMNMPYYKPPQPQIRRNISQVGQPMMMGGSNEFLPMDNNPARQLNPAMRYLPAQMGNIPQPMPRGVMPMVPDTGPVMVYDENGVPVPQQQNQMWNNVPFGGVQRQPPPVFQGNMQGQPGMFPQNPNQQQRW
ncbi:hypothetical protein HK098_000454 [Nowakowskiella sp. JEL0407]|nr:hypothetical protein HK098_000454 [Nowakowskiella sp. JEL0407]